MSFDIEKAHDHVRKALSQKSCIVIFARGDFCGESNTTGGICKPPKIIGATITRETNWFWDHFLKIPEGVGFAVRNGHPCLDYPGFRAIAAYATAEHVFVCNTTGWYQARKGAKAFAEAFSLQKNVEE